MRASFTLGSFGHTTGVGRPTYNTGIGLFVLNGVLYDSSGIAFRIRGLNRHDLTINAQSSMNVANANAIRIVDTNGAINLSGTAIECAADIAQSQVPIACSAYFPDGTLTTGSTSTTEFSALVSAWVSAFSSYSGMQKHMILNVANEWGPANSTVWRDSWISAISSLRTAGYTCPILVDTGGSGQDSADLLTYSSAVFNSDAQKNILFALHLYGNTPSVLSGSPNILQQLSTLGSSNGQVFIAGEFGDDLDLGGSTVSAVISGCESANIGWMPWAWDESGDNFQMCVTPGVYTGSSSQLTSYGQECVPSLQSLAVRATDFP